MFVWGKPSTNVLIRVIIPCLDASIPCGIISFISIEVNVGSRIIMSYGEKPSTIVLKLSSSQDLIYALLWECYGL